MKIVHPFGPQPSNTLLVGEAPGYDEMLEERPFVGKAGREQGAHFERCGESTKHFRLANVTGEYTRGNPDPTPEQIKTWTPILLREVYKTSPTVIIAVGKFAARWFLGESTDMFLVHGIPHKAGSFDHSRAPRGGPSNAIIIPIFHVASGFRSDKMRAIVWWDYQQVVNVMRQVRSGKLTVESLPHDEFADPIYMDVTGRELAGIIDSYQSTELGIDTEDDRPLDGKYRPWSIQVSCEPGMGMVLRYCQDDFQIGTDKLQEIANKGVTLVAHNWMHDIKVCREMRLDLSRANLHDTMRDLYLLRTEKWGLKQAMYRWCSVKNARDYLDVVGPATKQLREAFLQNIIDIGGLGDKAGIGDDAWPRIKPYMSFENDGTTKRNKPWQIVRRAKGILKDSVNGKVNKDGEPTDIRERWNKLPNDARNIIEDRLGMLPMGYLSDVPLNEAIIYAAGDPDWTLRLKKALVPEIKRLHLGGVQRKDMLAMPMFEAMQDHGLPTSKSRFESLSQRMTNRMTVTQARISHCYFDDKPFNPGSDKQTRLIMENHGLEGTKKTASGEISTAKDSIGHLRYTEPMITDIFYWRECAHVRDVDCAQALRKCTLENQDSNDSDIYYVKASLIPSTVTRRLTAKDPNSLAITKHGDFGLLVRDCYVAPKGRVFFEMDLSQIEVVVAANVSGDELLCKIITEGLDIHTETAAAIFRIPVETVQKDLHRLLAKTTFFGWMYGQGYAALSNQLLMKGLTGWTKSKCRGFQRKLQDTYWQLTEAIRDSEREVRKTGLVRSSSGMVRHLPGVWSEDDKIRSESARQAWSHIVQGTAQDAIQNSMIWLWLVLLDLKSRGHGIWPVLQVYDSLVFIVDDGENTKGVIEKLVYEALTKHHGLGEMRVPVRAEGSFGSSWADLD